MGLGASLISYSPNTLLKSADMNTNLSNLNNASSFNGGISATSFTLTHSSGNTEIGHYFIGGWANAAGDTISNYIPTLSRSSTPVSVSFDQADQAISAFLNAPNTGHLTIGGFQMFSISNAAGGNGIWGGNWTINY